MCSSVLSCFFDPCWYFCGSSHSMGWVDGFAAGWAGRLVFIAVFLIPVRIFEVVPTRWAGWLASRLGGAGAWCI